MVQLIIFYFLFIAYSVFGVTYIFRHYKRYLYEEKKYKDDHLDIDFRSVTRFFMNITIIVAIIGSELFFTIREDIDMTPGDIGISLASGTFIFFVLFLVWDICRPKIINFFKNKHDVELRKETVFGISIIISISLFALLLLEAVLSVIMMIRGDFL